MNAEFSKKCFEFSLRKREIHSRLEFIKNVVQLLLNMCRKTCHELFPSRGCVKRPLLQLSV
jgi:hypothetical protein